MRKNIFLFSAFFSFALNLPIEAAVTGTWLGGSGDWFTTAKWQSGVVPNGVDDAALFFNSGGTVTLSATPVMGSLSLSNANSYTIAGPGQLQFSESSDLASLSSQSANHVINAGISLLSSLTAQVSDHSLTINGDISGGSLLIKRGNGTLILNGNNSGHTGNTTVNGGTLQGNSQSLTGNITNGVTLNSTVVFNQTTPGSYAGNITGIGSVTIAGSDSLTFTGSNSYTGGTLISSGSLTVNTSTIQGDITNNAFLTFDQAANGTYLGKLSGTGIVTKMGAGILTLNNLMNDYIGGTNFNGGTISINASADLGGSGPFSFNTGTLQSTATLSLTPSLTTLTSGGGTIDVATGTTLTLSNPVTGPGGLTKIGSGTLILTPGVTDSDYMGGTTISAGTLQGKTMSIPGDIVNNSELVFDQIETGTHSGTISGTGSVTISGGGTVILDGTNDYSGGTTVTGTNLQGTTSSLQGNIFNSGTVIFDQSSSDTFVGTISGTGGVTNSGSGTVVFSTSQPYTGTTLITGGTLQVDSTLASTSVMISGGFLKGVGTIQNNVSANSGGTISPGHSPGTLILQDGVSFDSGSFFEVEIQNDGTASQLAVTGTTTIDPAATLQVVYDPGMYAQGTSWEILTTTNFASADQFLFTPPTLLPSLTVVYTATSISLLLGQATLVGIQTAGLSGNNLTLANYINSQAGNPEILDIIDDLLPYTGEVLNNYLTALSPLRLISQSFSSINTQFAFSDLLLTHAQGSRRISPPINQTQLDLASLIQQKFEERRLLVDNEETVPPTEEPKIATPQRILTDPYCFWASGFTQFTHEKGSDTNPSFSNTTGAFLLGFDFFRNEMAVFGTSLGYAHNSLTEAQDLGSATSNLYLLSLYGNLFYKEFYVGTALWGGYDQISNQRTISIPDTFEIVTADSHAWALTPHLDFGYDFQFGCLTLEPFAAFDWSCNWASKMDEKNDFPLGMEVNSRSFSMLRSELGLSLFEQIESKSGLFFARQTLSYVNKKPFSVGNITASISGQPSTFKMETFTDCQNLIAPGVEFFWKENNGTFFSILYEGEFGSGYKSNEVVGQIGVYF